MKPKDIKAWFFIFGLLVDILLHKDFIKKDLKKINYDKLKSIDSNEYMFFNHLINLFKETKIIVNNFKRKDLKYAKEIDDYITYIFADRPINDGYVPEATLIFFLNIIEYEIVIPILVRPYIKLILEDEKLLIDSILNEYNNNVIRNSRKFAMNIKKYILEGKKVDLHTQIAYVPSWAKSIKRN